MESIFEQIIKIQQEVKDTAPLIHCITNPISIHDCANVVLAAGARPIMAEHPEEVEQIVRTADALALNLGNITDARRTSIMLAGKAALKKDIPVILDMVGIGCSSLRKNLTEEFLKERGLKGSLILRGNMSEIKALAGFEASVSGVDVSPADVMTLENEDETAGMIQRLAKTYHCVMLVSGKTDIIADEEQVYFVENGCARMSQITGTGCMLNVLAASYMSRNNLAAAALAAAVTFGICGEMAAETGRGTGSFQVNLLDELSEFDSDIINKYAKIKRWDGR